MFTFEAHILKRIRFCSERHKAMLSEVPSFFGSIYNCDKNVINS